jgi:hypothetical protein
MRTTRCAAGLLWHSIQEITPMPTPEPRRYALLAYSALIVSALALSFGAGHLTGRLEVYRRYAFLTFDPPSADQRFKLEESGERWLQSRFAATSIKKIGHKVTFSASCPCI